MKTRIRALVLVEVVGAEVVDDAVVKLLVAAGVTTVGGTTLGDDDADVAVDGAVVALLLLRSFIKKFGMSRKYGFITTRHGQTLLT